MCSGIWFDYVRSINGQKHNTMKLYYLQFALGIACLILALLKAMHDVNEPQN